MALPPQAAPSLDALILEELAPNTEPGRHMRVVFEEILRH